MISFLHFISVDGEWRGGSVLTLETPRYSCGLAESLHQTVDGVFIPSCISGVRPTSFVTETLAPS